MIAITYFICRLFIVFNCRVWRVSMASWSLSRSAHVGSWVHVTAVQVRYDCWTIGQAEKYVIKLSATSSIYTLGHWKHTEKFLTKCQMSKWIKTAQFHAKRLDCARCTSISGTRSSSMYAERHRCLQSVHAVRQRRPADRVCYVDTAERSSGADWLIVDVDWRRRRLECSSWQDTLELCSPDTDGQWHLVSYNTWPMLIIKNLYMIC